LNTAPSFSRAKILQKRSNNVTCLYNCKLFKIRKNSFLHSGLDCELKSNHRSPKFCRQYWTKLFTCTIKIWLL
jgi:hypothetical protein